MTEWSYYSNRRKITLTNFCRQFDCLDYNGYLNQCQEKKLIPLSAEVFLQTLEDETPKESAPAEPVKEEPAIEKTQESPKPRRRTKKKSPAAKKDE